MSYFEFPHTRSYDGDLGYIIKRLNELTAKYGEFMEYNQIKFADPLNWDINAVYAAWNIVFDTSSHGYYLSKKPVPAGIAISNTDYWELIIPFEIDTALNVDSYNPIANAPVTSRFNQIAASINNISNMVRNEGIAREEADNELSLRITANADDISTLNGGLTHEATERETADTNLSRDIDSLNARVDNIAQTIVPGGTSGDAELADIRLGANGVTYPNAGDAVRALDTINGNKINDTNNALNAIASLNNCELLITDWEVGSLNTNTGEDLSSTTRIRTVGYIDISNIGELHFDIESGYKYVVDWYAADKSFVKVGIATVWQTADQTVTKPNGVSYMRLIISKDPDAPANTTFAANLKVTYAPVLVKDVKASVRANQIRVGATAVLGDLDNAEPNVIYNISNILHLIGHIPADIPLDIVNATTWTLAGETTTTTNWRVQYLLTGATAPVMYYRMRMNNTWRAWQKVATAVDNANLMNLNYYNANCVNKLEIDISNTSNIIAFGDSITAGNGETSWTYHFNNIVGCSINNKAIAGATFGESISTTDKWISTQLEGVTSEEWSAADYIIVAAGTNDGVHDTPDDELLTKIESAIATIKANTNAPIIFITPIRRNTPTYSENLKLPYISGIITNSAVASGCNVINGFTFPIASETNGQIVNLTRDGLHPNATGANVYARCVINAIW